MLHNVKNKGKTKYRIYLSLSYFILFKIQINANIIKNILTNPAVVEPYT